MNALGFCTDPSMMGQMEPNAHSPRRPYRSFDVFNQSNDRYIEQANFDQVTPSGDHNRNIREMMSVHFAETQFGG